MHKQKYTKAFLGGTISYKEKQIEGIASSEIKDRVGETLKVDGWDLKAFKNGGPLLWAHLHRELPVGRITKVFVDGKDLKFKAIFDDNNAFAREVQGAVERGFVNKLSVGFRPLEFDDEFNVIKQELVEISLVNVPALDAAQITREKKDKDLAEFQVKVKEYEKTDEEKKQTSKNDTDPKRDLATEVNSLKNAIESIGKEGRTLSEATRNKLRNVKDAMDAALDPIEDLLKSTDSPKSGDKTNKLSRSVEKSPKREREIKTLRIIVRAGQILLEQLKMTGGDNE